MYRRLMAFRVGRRSASSYQWWEVIQRDRLGFWKIGEEWTWLSQGLGECSSLLAMLSAFQLISISMLWWDGFKNMGMCLVLRNGEVMTMFDLAWVRAIRYKPTKKIKRRMIKIKIRTILCPNRKRRKIRAKTNISKSTRNIPNKNRLMSKLTSERFFSKCQGNWPSTMQLLLREKWFTK